MTDKLVNVKIQCLSSIFLPTGIYGFHKIKKLKIGIIIYVISEVIGYVSGIIGGSMFYLSQDWWTIIAPIALSILVLSFMIPVVFMRKYCLEYNVKIKQITY